MFHKNAANAVRNIFPVVSGSLAELVSDAPTSQHHTLDAAPPAAPRLRLVSAKDRSGAGRPAAPGSRAVLELLSIAARRCSAFFAEAAVLVLVFGILDFFMLKGRIELGWVGGAFAISLGLLVASIGTDFSARRWLGAQP